MNTVIITVAGTATRFNKDTKTDVLKCLYYEECPTDTLIYNIFKKSSKTDQFVVVGGYLYKQLEEYISTYCVEFTDRITLIYNDKFDSYGSGYSLIIGIKNLPTNTDEVIFVEGDLFFDKSSYQQLFKSTNDAITINRDPIEASKAVAVVVDADGHPYYIYDTKHKLLNFNNPFSAIYNSAQMWKFKDIIRLKQVLRGLSQAQIEGTNLEIISGYFMPLNVKDIDIITFEQWCNCNTVSDYKSIFNK